MRKSILAIILCLFVAAQVKAQWTNNAALNTTVKDVAGVEELTPLSATTDDGKTYVSWFAMNSSTAQYDLYLQLLDAQGNLLFGPGGLLVSNQPSSQTIYRYDLKVDHEGNAIVAFQDLRTAADYVVSAYKISSTGAFVWGNNGVTFVDTAASQSLAPVIGINADNSVLVAWNANAGNKKWIAYQKLNAGGNAQFNYIKRIQDVTGTKKYSRPYPLPGATNNEFMLHFIEETGNFPGLTCKLMANKIDNTGAFIWPSHLQISTKTTTAFFFPSPIADGKGGFYVGINTGNPANQALTDTYIQHVSNSGGLWSATGTEADPSTSNHKFFRGLALDTVNSKLAALLQYTNSGQSQAGLAVQFLDTAGALQSPVAYQLLPQVSTIIEPDGIAASGNSFMIIYHDGGFGAQTMSACKVDLTGSLLWSGNSIPLASAANNKDDVSVGLFKNNQVVAVWYDTRQSAGIYAQNIQANGSLGANASGIQTPDWDAVSCSFHTLASDPSVSVSFGLAGKYRVRTLDMLGRMIGDLEMQATEGQVLRLPLSGYSAGNYVLQVSGKSGQKSMRFIIP